MTKIAGKKPIIIKETDFVKGISSSSVAGFQAMQNIDIFNVDGVAKAGFEGINTIPDPVSTTFTADAATDICTVASTFDITRESITFTATGRVVQLTSTGTLPAGLSLSTNYFIIKVTSTTIKLATTLANALAGTPIDIIGAGTGVHTITSVNPRRFEHYAVNIISGSTNAADQVFAQDAVGKIWKYSSASGWYLLTGNSPDGLVGAGLAIWKNYLFSFKQTAVDVYGPLDSSPAWSNNWAGAVNVAGGNAPLDKNYHKAWVGQDLILYFANYASNIPYVGSLLEVPTKTFSPSDATTYTWNAYALDLPNYAWITDFEELGVSLMVATATNYIYPWDRVSASFDAPIPTLEAYVSALKTVNNRMYYACGTRGNIYVTLGTTSSIVMDFSDQLSNVPQSNMLINDIELWQGYLMFCTSGATPGVYLLDINNSNRYTLHSTLTNSSGIPMTLFTNNNPSLYNLNYVSQRYFVSWSDNIDASQDTTRGCDSNFMLTNGPYRASGDISYFLSETYFVGDDKDSRTFEQIEVILMDPITSGHAIKISSRIDDSSSFSNEVSLDYTAFSAGGGISASGIPNITDAHIVQLKVVISIPANSGQATSQYVTPIIKQIQLA